VPRQPLVSRASAGALRVAPIVAVLGLLLTALGPLTTNAAAADPLTLEARILLGGHARAGSWVAISVHLKNDGPAITGEIRLTGGSQGQTRFGVPVDLPTQSDKTYVLYAQPPAFGSQLEVALADDHRTIASTIAKYTLHDATQLVVAVIAEHPDRIVANLGLLPNQNQVAPLVLSVSAEDLPERVEAWSLLDRIVWQDVDSDRLTVGQLAAMRGWVAAGGRLVITGGTAGPKALAAFPDAMLPYRPDTTTDLPAANLSGILGQVPPTASTVPALSGALIDGRPLAMVGDRVVAAERAYGSGSVTVLGFDPTVDWIAAADTSRNLWRRLLPARGPGGLAINDDNMLVSAVSQLPSLALPPIGGLIALLGAYILLIGPINYFVLRRLDRREWAWFTMPALIVVFAVGAYGFGAALRGTELIINEVAIVRGAPGATDGTAQVYVGVFSPSRAVYQLRLPGGPLLSSPLNGDAFGGNTTATSLDVLQGDPAQIRDLAVGFGSLRTVRAETAVVVPLVKTDLRLVDGHIRGTITNASSARLEHPAVVLGSTVALVKDLEPGEGATIDVVVQGSQFGQSLSDKVVGQVFFNDSGANADSARLSVRHNMVDQLTFDPNFGPTNLLASDGPVVLAWGSDNLVPVEIANQPAQHLGNVLYYLPARLAISGTTTFRSDLLRSIVVGSDAPAFTKDPNTLSFGRGSATVAYRPIAFDGTFSASELAIALNFGDSGLTAKPATIDPLPSIPPPCPNPPTADCVALGDGLPEVELFDVGSQGWKRLPHLAQGTRYAVTDAARYVDPTSGTVLVRYVNDRADSVGFNVDLSISGEVR
jgi:hypothetical protein